MMNIKRTAEDAAAGEDPDELYLPENVFWVPKEARRSHLQANAKQPSIGKLIDVAMAAILCRAIPSESSRIQSFAHHHTTFAERNE